MGLGCRQAARLEEGEGHAATDDDLVGLVEEHVDGSELGGDLRASDDGGEGPLDRGRVAQCTIEVVELLVRVRVRVRVRVGISVRVRVRVSGQGQGQG